MAVELYPTRLQLLEQGALQIQWSDGRTDEIALRSLRTACPCARCRNAESTPPTTGNLFPVIQSEHARPLSIRAMRPVGNYAYNIEFSDGHNTGIFSFELLRNLGGKSLR